MEIFEEGIPQYEYIVPMTDAEGYDELLEETVDARAAIYEKQHKWLDKQTKQQFSTALYNRDLEAIAGMQMLWPELEIFNEILRKRKTPEEWERFLQVQIAMGVLPNRAHLQAAGYFAVSHPQYSTAEVKVPTGSNGWEIRCNEKRTAFYAVNKEWGRVFGSLSNYVFTTSPEAYFNFMDSHTFTAVDRYTKQTFEINGKTGNDPASEKAL